MIGTLVTINLDQFSIIFLAIIAWLIMDHGNHPNDNGDNMDMGCPMVMTVSALKYFIAAYISF